MQQDKPITTKQVKNYVINLESQIGKGFSSTVYRGHNVNNQEQVAIKVVDTKGVKTEVEHMLLRNEIRALKMMSHQNVIHTFEVCQTANNVYIITEVCQQGDLATLVKDKGTVGVIEGPMREEEALRLFKQIIKGLQHIHSKGIIHRDIKSANIFIKNGVLKIADFGFCEFVSEKYGQQGYNVGSPLYMSPEAYKKTQYSEKSDCWAAGVILFEMLIGDTPFKGVDYNTLMKQIASAEIYKNLNVSGFTKMLISRMLSLDIQRRADATEALNLLRGNQPKIISETIIQRPVSQTNAREPALQVPSSFKSKCPQQIITKPPEPKPQLVVKPAPSNILDVKSGNVSPGMNPAKKRMCHTATNIHMVPTESSPKKNQLHPAVAARSSAEGKGIKLEEKIEKARIMQTCCEIFQQSSALTKIHLLCLKHLQYIAKEIEQILKSNPTAMQNYKAIYKGISERVADLLSKAQFNKIGTDAYFTYVVSEVNPESQPFSNFTQFWLRSTFQTLRDSIQKYQSNPLDKYHLQLTYNTLLYGAKYYKILLGTSKQTAQICNAEYTLDLLLKDTSGPSSQNIQVLSDATRILIN